ncbi:MAG: hypothetical protein CM15mP121_1350 [Bacteroidota bacterium]|nr:MAG: hypothetical protein CM15mP121_1350 [Bacteroidota bacterium]
MKSVLSGYGLDYVKCISERAVMSINGGKKIVSIKSLDKNFSKRNVDSILYAGSWPKRVKKLLLVGGLLRSWCKLNNYENPINFFVPVAEKDRPFKQRIFITAVQLLHQGSSI